MNYAVLDNVDSYKRTKSCYLDGRYIPLVLGEVAEFIKIPLVVSIVYAKENGTQPSQILHERIESDFFELRKGMNIMRIVVQSTYMLHSALLWLDTVNNTLIITDVLYNENDARVNAIKDLTEKLVRQYFEPFGDFEFSSFNVQVPHVEPESNCVKYGFCNAYVIKQVLDHVNDIPFNSNSVDILKYAAAIEMNYREELDPTTKPEVEYFIGLGLGLGVGLLGGLAIGGAVASTNRRHTRG